jgi:transaldolase
MEFGAPASEGPGEGGDAMRFFLDTADLDAIRRWRELGLVEGATTNPALLARAGVDPLERLRQVAELVPGPVSAQVTHEGARAMIAQGRALAAVAPNVVVKVPATVEGHRAAAALAAEGIDCNVTLAFHPAQLLPFARVPVAFVSLIVGRVEDFGLTLRDEIRRAREVLDRLESPTRLLVASLRNPTHVCDAIAGGADAVTVPPSTWELVLENPLTRQGQADFARAWSELAPEVRGEYERLGTRAG